MGNVARNLQIDKSTGNLVLTLGNLTLVYDEDAIVQAINAALKFCGGEWFLNTAEGVPYFTQFFIKKPAQSAMRAALFSAIANVRGVSQVISLSLTVNTAARTLSVVWSALADTKLLTGTVQVSP